MPRPAMARKSRRFMWRKLPACDRLKTSWNLDLLLLRFRIEARREVFLRDLRFHAIGRQFRLRRPEDGIEHEIASHQRAPQRCRGCSSLPRFDGSARPGKAEATIAAGPFHRPGDMLTFLVLEHGRIAAMHALGPVQVKESADARSERSGTLFPDPARHPRRQSQQRLCQMKCRFRWKTPRFPGGEKRLNAPGRLEKYYSQCGSRSNTFLPPKRRYLISEN